MTKESTETLPTHSSNVGGRKKRSKKLSLCVSLVCSLCGASISLFLHLYANALRSKHTGGLPSHYTLPSGDKIPSVALGVWQAPPDEVGGAVRAALKAGYRHIDGAWIYGNEKEVGKAIYESGVPVREGSLLMCVDIMLKNGCLA